MSVIVPQNDLFVPVLQAFIRRHPTDHFNDGDAMAFVRYIGFVYF